MFKGEAIGLTALYDTHTLKIPKVYDYGIDEKGTSFVVMEYLNFGGGSSDKEFGR